MSNENQTLLKKGFSWSSPREPKKKERRYVLQMRRRRIDDDEVSVHNRVNNRTITISQTLSERIYYSEMKYAGIHFENGRLLLGFHKHEYTRGLSIISYNTQGRKPIAVISRKYFVDLFCKHFKVPEGDYFVRFDKYDPRPDNEEHIFVELVSLTERQPLSTINQTPINMADNNQKKPEDLFTAKELWDALKRLGYSGEVSRIEKLD